MAKTPAGIYERSTNGKLRQCRAKAKNTHVKCQNAWQYISEISLKEWKKFTETKQSFWVCGLEIVVFPVSENWSYFDTVPKFGNQIKHLVINIQIYFVIKAKIVTKMTALKQIKNRSPLSIRIHMSIFILTVFQKKGFF